MEAELNGVAMLKGLISTIIEGAPRFSAAFAPDIIVKGFRNDPQT